MGRVLLLCRLAGRDLRRRRGEAALLLLAMMAATATLSLGLVLHGVTTHPYQRTRAATAGPDVVAAVGPPTSRSAALAALQGLAHARGVVGHSGPYPVVAGTLRAHGRAVQVQAVGRDAAPASIDRPKLSQGRWVARRGAVLEGALADALGVGVGDRVTVNGRSFRVRGVAVTAAVQPYPTVPSYAPGAPSQPGVRFDPAHPPPRTDTGLVWLSRADALRVSATQPASYLINLKLADPARAPAFVDARTVDRAGAPILQSWQDILDQASHLVRNEQRVLVTGGWLLGVLAVASVAVLVGGRMSDQVRRVGLLKAVGGTPGLVAAVLLAEYLVVALLADVAGLALGWLAAPSLIDRSAGLVGTAGAPPLTMSTIGLVTAVALGVAVAATVVPAVRAARTSTVRALADAARPPRRTAWLIRLSARLPVSLLLGLRVAARRPRRVVLGAASIAITVSGIVAVLAVHAQVDAQQLAASSGSGDPEAARLNQVLLVITVMLVALAAVNAVFITWATVLDTRHASALARALGATPGEISAGLSMAQLVPALAGAVLGIPLGLGLYVAVDPDEAPLPPLWWLVGVVPATVLVVAALTTVPARLGARRPVAEVLQAETV